MVTYDVKMGFYYVSSGEYVDDSTPISSFPPGSTLRIHMSPTKISFPYIKEYLFNFPCVYVPFVYQNKPVYIERHLDE